MTVASSFPDDSALDFLQHLWALNRAMERTSMQMERELGVTAQQRFLIRCVGAYPGLTGSQLATLLHLDRGTVSTSLRRLEAKGLVSKQANPSDSRKLALALTAKGRALDRPAPATIEHAVARLLRRLGPANVLAVKQALRGLADDLTKDLPDEP